MITQEKFKSLLNGTGSAGGSKLLAAEIAGLELENEQAVAELGTIPAKRAELILSDDPSASIDNLEHRERELERVLERNSIQLEPLKERLSELRRVELAPRIAHHQQALNKCEIQIGKAVAALIAANEAGARALQDAINEVGDAGTPLMTLVQFGGVANEMCLDMWRANLERQRESIARFQNSIGRDPNRKPAFDLDSLQPAYIRSTSMS